jgi:hypothetical protein
MIGVQTRAHRILKKLDGYRSSDSIAPRDATVIKDLLLDPAERIVGIYENDPSRSDGNVIVTDLGIYVGSSRACTSIRYSDMEAVQVLDEKGAADRLVVRLAGGRVVEVPIVGGNRRFRDVWEFSHFLQRVRSDIGNRPNAHSLVTPLTAR